MEKAFPKFYYPIEYYHPHVHLEYNYENPGLNEAEIKALQQEEYKNKYEKIKEIKNREYINKYNKSALLYVEEQRMKNREEELNRKREQNEQMLKKQNYNKTVFQKNMKPFLKEKELKAKTIDKMKKSKSLNKKETKINNHFKTQKLDNIKNEFIIFDKKIQKEINDGYSDNLDDRELQDNLNSKKIFKNEKNKNENKKEDSFNNNVVDLRYNLENQLIEEIRNKNRTINTNELKNEVDNKLDTIKRFRNFGYLPGQTSINREKKKKKDNKKFSSEYERRRFNKSLRNVINERLGKQNIDVQKICNCGKLHKQLDEFIEKGKFIINDLSEVECENNCIFYKNQKEYLKKINEVLNSVKDLALQYKIKENK
jgi:hypothetical protein